MAAYVVDDFGNLCVGQTVAKRRHPAPPLQNRERRIRRARELRIPRECRIHGAHVQEVDILLTAGPNNSPNELPEDFLADRQANHRDPGTLTFFLNFAALAGSPAIPGPDGSIVRPELIARGNYGLTIRPRATDGVVLYLEGAISAVTHDILDYVEPNQTTLVDIVLTRVVRSGVFTFTKQLAPRSFKNDAFGNPI